MTCLQAAEVISRAVDMRLSTIAQVSLGVHTLFCGPCRRFRRQLSHLHAMCGQILSEQADPAGNGLSIEAKARIIAGLEPTTEAE